MRQRSLPLLLLLVAVLAGVAWWLRDGGEPAVAPGRLPLLDALRDDRRQPLPEIDELRLRNADGSKEYRVARANRGWRLIDPVEDEASSALVEAWVGQLQAAEQERAFADEEVTPKVLEETGLAKPKGSVIVVAGRREVRIEFGAETFPPGNAFARVAGRLCRIPFGIDQMVETNLHDLRNRLLFNTPWTEVTEVDIERRDDGGASRGIRLRLDRTARFVVRDPQSGEDLPASHERVGLLLQLLLAARIRQFHPSLSQAAPAEAWMKIRVRGGFGDETAAIEAPSDGVVYAVKSGRPVRLELDDKTFRTFVDVPVAQLIDTSLWTFAPAQANRIHVTPQGEPSRQPFVLEQLDPGPGFRLVQPAPRLADPTAVNELLGALDATRLVEVLTGEAAAEAARALQVPWLKIRLESPRSRQMPAIELALGLAAGDRLVARRGDAPQVYRVECPRQILERPWWQLAERIVFRSSAERPADKITIEQPARTRTWELQAKGWVSGGSSEDAFEDVADVLREVRAERVVGLRSGGVLEGRPRQAVIRCLARGGPVPDRILASLEVFESAEPGVLLASVEGDPMVFQVKAGRWSSALRAVLK
jgi:hypothetical protein